MTINDHKLRVELARHNMTMGELATAAGISRNRLYIIKNSKSITPKSAGMIAKALGVDVTEIID